MNLRIIAVLFLISLGLFTTSAHAVVHEYNFTNVNVTAGSFSMYFDLATGTNSTVSNSSMDIHTYIPVSTLCWDSLNGAMFSQVRGNLDINASFVGLQSWTGCSFQGGLFGNSTVPNRFIFVVKTHTGNYALMKWYSGNPNFEFSPLVTIRYQDDGSLNFIGTLAGNFTGNYRFVNLTDFGFTSTVLDLEYGYLYIPFSTAYGDIRFSNFPSSTITSVNGAKFAVINQAPSFVDCSLYLSNITLTSSPQSWQGKTFCVRRRDNAIVKVWTDQNLSSFGGGNEVFYSELTPITVPAFQTGLVQGTDVTTTYFSFETLQTSSTIFNGADFLYDSTQNPNILNPSTNTDGMDFLTYSNTNNNDLASWDCSLDAPFSYASRQVYPVSIYSPTIWCFNITTANGQKTYGAIKIITNENVRGGIAPDLDFFYAIYTSGFISFSNVQWMPATPVASNPITVTWETSVPVTTILRFRYNTSSGNFTPFITLADNSLNTSHTMTIPSGQSFATNYEIQPAGSDAGNSFNSGDIFNFTAFPANFTVTVDSLGVYTFNEYGFPTPAGISLDGGLAQTTQKFVNTQGESVYGVVFPKALATIGIHNLSATSFAQSSRSIQTSVNIVAYPTFVKLILKPQNSCVPASFRGSETFCNDTLRVINLTNIGATGAYCRFNPNECNLYNYSTGSCLLTAGQRTPPVSWVAYACYDNYNPTNADISTPNTNGQVLPVGTGISGEGNALPNSLLSLTTEQQLNILAMIITLLITIGVALVTKEVGGTGIVFVGLLTAFTFIGWLPFWILLIMAVITAFLVARFFRVTVSSQ